MVPFGIRRFILKGKKIDSEVQKSRETCLRGTVANWTQLSQLFITRYTSKILLALQLASQNDLREIRMLESLLVIVRSKFCVLNNEDTDLVSFPAIVRGHI
jgi:hypothetical protein